MGLNKMSPKLKCNIYVKCALFNTGIFILSFVGTSYLTRKGLTGLSDYKEEQQYQPSRCYVDKIHLFTNDTNAKWECSAMIKKYQYQFGTTNFNQCLEIVDSPTFQNGDVKVHTDTYPHSVYLRYTVHDNVSILLPRISRV